MAVDGSWCKPPRPPGQRVAKRNARKENLVKCVLAPRFLSEPRRGSQCSSLHRTPPRPSGSPRNPAGTILRRPPYSNFARMCKVAAKAPFSLIPGAARSLFGADKKRMGGASPLDKPPCGSRIPPGRRPALIPYTTRHPGTTRGAQAMEGLKAQRGVSKGNY